MLLLSSLPHSSLRAVAPLPLFAQVEKSVITGQVKDASGAVIGQAHVALKNIATGIVTKTTSDG